ncbi:MAG: aldo/keto reductase [Patescibacteria group bacterium]|jgi:diketogulonate reductase-like aldo/keto reductase|nr:aldo/keto reductase [Patescibacteria group bacterium]
MNIPIKRLDNGFSLPVLGLGTYGMGGGKERDFQNDDNADIAALRTAFDLGITHLDTAEVYAQGHAEELIAQALVGRNRKNFLIVSKVYADNLKRDDVIKSCQATLKRLQLDYLDVYLIHKFNPNVALSQTLAALDELVARGLIKHIGVSNFSVQHLKEAQSYSKNKIVCNQVHYNLICREPQRKGLLSYCQENDIMLVAWRPVERGGLAEATNDLMTEMKQKYQKTAAQIAINWLISQPQVVTIVKSSNLHHLRENLGATDWLLEPLDVERLTAQYPGQQSISYRQPLSDELIK